MTKNKIIISTLITFIVAMQLINSAIAGSKKDFIQEDFDKAVSGSKNLTGIKIEGATLAGLNFCGADFRFAEMEKVNFKGANFSGANFEGADLEDVNFEGANLTNANFKNADLEGANLHNAKIEGANFQNAELEFAKWTNGRVCGEGSIGGCW